MSRLFRDSDADLRHLTGRRVVIYGYGNQGHAHALNLRDAGVDVRVVAKPGSDAERRAAAEGFPPTDAEEGARTGDVLMLLVPDEAQAPLYRRAILPHLRAGQHLAFGHGFNVHFGLIAPPAEVGVFMVAPVAPGHAVRSRFLAGGGVPAYVAVHRDLGETLALALAYGAALGAGRVLMLETSFAEECECDLFGEQTVVCGGLSALITSAFDTLVGRGYQPEVAYLEVAHQVSLLAEMIQRQGIAGMRRAISTTALYGDLTRGPRVVGDAARRTMDEILDEIRDGRFKDELLAEHAAGRPTIAARLAAGAAHPIEAVGKKLRDAMDKGPPAGQNTGA